MVHTHSKVLLSACLVFCLISTVFAFADTVWACSCWTEEQKILASDGAADDGFGCSISISSDLAIIGAYGDDDLSGSAYIFKLDGTSWSEEAKLVASDGTAGDMFGYSVSISSDLVIIGAYGDDDNGQWSGSAYIFRRDGTSWSEEAKLIAPDGVIGEQFGISVSISGNYAIVGAKYGEGNGSNTGSAYIFKFDGISWSEEAKLVASDGASNDMFGRSVSISDDYAIVGARYDDDNGSNSGSAYVFSRDETGWSEQAKLLASDGAVGDQFGNSVSISGDYAIVGACYDDDKGFASGSAYIFRRDGTNWNQEAKLVASDGAASDTFGWSVSISGDLAIIGADTDDDKGIHSGSAYIFMRDGTIWTEQAKLVASDGDEADYFGGAVSIRSDYAIVGASNKDSHKGSAYIFNKFCTRSDLNDDCKVNFADFAIFTDWWLYGTD